MTPRYPGAFWVPTGDAGGMAGLPDAGSLHIAVTRAKSVAGWVQSEKSCQAYNGQHGRFEQYMDLDRRANGVSSGNSHVITVESFDGLLIHNDPYWEEGMGGVYGTDADNGVWDDGQAERAADFIAWCGSAIGIAVTESHRAGDPGWGPHRLGVEPWRSDVYGHGEVWTQHNGKRCPGDARVAQIPSIIARAKVIAAAVAAGQCTWLPPGEVDVPSALARTGKSPIIVRPSGPTSNPSTPPAPVDLLEEIMALDRTSDDYKNFVSDIADKVLAAQVNVSFPNEEPKSLQLRDVISGVASQTRSIWQRTADEAHQEGRA